MPHALHDAGGLGAALPPPVQTTVRCAIYTRKSVEDRTDNGFTSLDAQREAGEAYVATMRQEGWVVLPDRYDDGGFTGGNTDRPALQRLMQDVIDSKVDTIIVYKIDRLSRSLLDFLKLIEMFDKHRVAFVAVTQQINTATSAGKLMLHILASFASYERALISERTSDKMCAARRKGKWCGGPPILGYDIDPSKPRMLVNTDEAAMVRDIFALFLKFESSIKVAAELNRRGQTTKSWVRKDGFRVPGTHWNKARVLRLLSNVTYTGKLIHKGELYEGEHESLITEDVFDRVQSIIDLNGNGSSPVTRNVHSAMLRGLLRCGRCGAAMAHTYTKKGDRLYRYYACNTRQGQGRDACKTPSLAAFDVESFVVHEIRRIGQDPALVDAVYTEAVQQQQLVAPALEAERRRLLKDRQRKAEEIKRLIAVLTDTTSPLASVSDHLRQAEASAAQLDVRLAELDQRLLVIRSQTIDMGHLRDTLAKFDPIWDVLHPAEQIALVHQVISSAVYDVDSQTIRLTFRNNSSASSPVTKSKTFRAVRCNSARTGQCT